MSKPNGARGARYLVVSGNLYLARTGPLAVVPVERGRSEDRRLRGSTCWQPVNYASRFWGGGVVQA